MSAAAKRKVSSVGALKRSKSQVERTPGVALKWLVKAEPADVTLEQIARDGTTLWSGVRNHVAKNNLVGMRAGDLVLFQVSNVTKPAVQGVLRVESPQAVADPTQFDQASCYFDDTATRAAPKWFAVTLSFVHRFARPVSRESIKSDPVLQQMQILTKARLSVTAVSDVEFARIVELGGGMAATTSGDDDVDDSAAAAAVVVQKPTDQQPSETV